MTIGKLQFTLAETEYTMLRHMWIRLSPCTKSHNQNVISKIMWQCLCALPLFSSAPIRFWSLVCHALMAAPLHLSLQALLPPVATLLTSQIRP